MKRNKLLANTHFKLQFQEGPLFETSALGDASEVSSLIEAKINVNAKGVEG